jgi:hypothetical protein
VTGPSGYIARFWRRIHIGHNPLARTSDRVEGALLLVVVVGILVALPVAALLGAGTYQEQLALSDQQRASRHLAVATLTEKAPNPLPTTDGAIAPSLSAIVHARWTGPGGAERVGTIPADPGTPAGSTVPVWLTEAGDPAEAPMSEPDVTTSAVLSAFFAWLIAVLILLVTYRTGRFLLDRRRVRRWDLEWASAGEKWARF